MGDDEPREAIPEERWPRASDRMFREAGWPPGVRVAASPAERFYRMPMGYKRAGDILADRAEADPVDRENIVFGALFCYRQSLELFMKRILEAFGEPPGCPPTHDLTRLWKAVAVVLDERTPGNPDDLDTVGNLIREMHDADQASDGFRYPSTRNGAPFTSEDRDIDLNATRDVMCGLQNFFECCYLALDALSGA
jgi:hypothetical protein